jgi:hypothetical protein
MLARSDSDHQRSVFFVLAIAGCLLALALLVIGAAMGRARSVPSEARVRVVAISGDVRARTASFLPRRWRSLAEHDRLSPNAHVVTGLEAAVELELGSGARIRLGPQSAVIVRSMGEGDPGKPALRVSSGTVLVHVLRDLMRGRHFVVETPTAVAGVRGTIFDVRVTPEHTAISVWEGVVEVTARASTEAVLVSAGEEAVVDVSAKAEVGKVSIKQLWAPRQDWLKTQSLWEKEQTGEDHSQPQQSQGSPGQEEPESARVPDQQPGRDLKPRAERQPEVQPEPEQEPESEPEPEPELEPELEPEPKDPGSGKRPPVGPIRQPNHGATPKPRSHVRLAPPARDSGGHPGVARGLAWAHRESRGNSTREEQKGLAIGRGNGSGKPKLSHK